MNGGARSTAPSPAASSYRGKNTFHAAVGGPASSPSAGTSRSNQSPRAPSSIFFTTLVNYLDCVSMVKCSD